jgi:membrane protein
MTFKIKDAGRLLKTTFKAWNYKDPFRESAVIAYYALFGIPALLILISTITGYFFEKVTINERIIAQVSSTMGPDIAAQIKAMLISSGQTNSTLWGSIIGVSTLLIGATGVFVELQKTLNAIWKVEVVPQKSIFSFVKARVFSFGLILGVAFLLLISLVVSTGLASLTSWIRADATGFMIIVLNAVNFIASLLVISILFALMFKIIPDAEIEWKHVWLGSVLSALLFTIGKTALAFYFGTAHPDMLYGAAGSVILILLWVSYSSMIMFFGAEFTAAYARLYSGKIPPSEIAVSRVASKSGPKRG